MGAGHKSWLQQLILEGEIEKKNKPIGYLVKESALCDEAMFKNKGSISS
jgi:hypothetical protein